jgi:hypothetical protein
MKASEFDEQFDRGDSVVDLLDLESVQRPGHVLKRVDIDFPLWMVQMLDMEASRLGISRQAVIKIWLAERLEQQQAIRTS